jgi:SARP family transcriptional regulator, regulator of embCAB operon
VGNRLFEYSAVAAAATARRPATVLEPGTGRRVEMKLGILGPLSVMDAEGRPCEPRGSKLRALLASLLVQHGRVVPTEQLIDELWDGHPRRTARNALQVAVSTLRKRLQSASLAPAVAAIVTHPAGYLIELDRQEFDLPCFESDLRRGQEAERRGELAAAANLLGRALAHWRGSALCDVHRTPALEAKARELDELCVAAQETRIAIELSRGRHVPLVAELFALVAEHPLRERLHEYLMVALHNGGRPAEALEVYQGIRMALRTQLGLEPGRNLRELQRAVLSRDPFIHLARGRAHPVRPATRASGFIRP